MFKILFLFTLLIIATFSETTEEANKENEKGEGEVEEGSGEESGKEKVESEKKSENSSGKNSSGNKELQQFAKLTKGVNAVDKEFNSFLSNYKNYLMDSDPRIAKKYGAVVNKTEVKDYESERKPINIEESKKLAKEIRMDMRQFMQNLKGKNVEKGNGGDEGKDKNEKNGRGGHDYKMCSGDDCSLADNYRAAKAFGLSHFYWRGKTYITQLKIGGGSRSGGGGSMSSPRPFGHI